MTSKLRLLLCLAALALPACAGSGQSMRATPSAIGTSGVMDDTTISARVKAVLLSDPEVDATKIDVATTSGIVTLSGSVKSKAHESRAIQLAHQVTGVRDVKSTLVIPGA